LHEPGIATVIMPAPAPDNPEAFFVADPAFYCLPDILKKSEFVASVLPGWPRATLKLQ
jgi:hypothetical protein